jgi:hypothetical protein
MSKPEDIPGELIHKWGSVTQGETWSELIAARLNAAIEAGVVSPPCWNLVSSDGFKSTTVYKTKEYAERVAYPNAGQWYKVEHWKGQME